MRLHDGDDAPARTTDHVRRGRAPGRRTRPETPRAASALARDGAR